MSLRTRWAPVWSPLVNMTVCSWIWAAAVCLLCSIQSSAGALAAHRFLSIKKTQTHPSSQLRHRGATFPLTVCILFNNTAYYVICLGCLLNMANVISEEWLISVSCVFSIVMSVFANCISYYPIKFTRSLLSFHFRLVWSGRGRRSFSSSQ